MKKRNVSIELMRLLACVIVIGTHIRLSSKIEGGGLDFSRILITCLLSDGVAIFWLITGFFIFRNTNSNNSSYYNLISKNIKNILLPLIALSLFSFYLNDFLVKDTSLIDSIHHTKNEYLNLFFSLLSAKNPIDNCGHTWYLFTYMFIIILFPLLKSFVQYLDEDTVRVKYFVIFTFVFIMVNDLTQNKLGEFSLHSINSVFPAALQIIIGHILYREKDKIFDKLPTFIYFLAFIIINVLRAIIQINNYNLGNTNFHIIFWYSSLGLLSALSIVGFSFKITKRVNTNLAMTIKYLAGYSFLIYLTHPLIKAILYKYDINTKIYKFLNQYYSNILFEVIYTITMIAIVFMISLIFSIIFRKINLYLSRKISKLSEYSAN